MKNFIGIAISLILVMGVISIVDTQPERLPVKRDGETVITKRIEDNFIEIKIKTWLLQRKSLTKENAGTFVGGSLCYEFKASPCSVVKNIGIKVDGAVIIVPVSALSDLFEVHRVWIEKELDDFVLIMEGADAAYSYMVKIKFDKMRVKQKIYIAGEADKVLYETEYYRVVL